MDDAMVGPVRGDYDNGGDRGVDSPNLRAREQDKFLPIAIVSRIMKQAVPINGKIAKEAKDAMQECVSEFISFITSEASYKCQKEKRKTINGDDLLWAMSILGFEDYIEPLRLYLAKYREMECDSKGPAKCGGSFQKDGGGNQSDFKSQVTHQESFTEAMHYMNSQATTDQHPVAPIPDSEWNSG